MNWRLVILAALVAVIGRARVAVLPGWVVPVPAALLAVVTLLALARAARVALALLASRNRLPYVAVAVGWQEVRP